MKVGDLVKFDRINGHTTHLNNKIALYLGEDIIERSDGRKIINYAFWVGGQRVIADISLLSYLKPLTSS